MDRLQRAATLALLVDALREHGSWAGETHLQKATFLLQHATRVPLGYDFILYKHGPFSFDLRSDLNDFASDGLLEVEPQEYPYGPRLRATQRGRRNIARDQAVNAYQHAIDEVVNYVGDKGVSSLEQVATAFLFHEESPTASDEEIAQRLVTVKPHVSRFDALSAVKDVRKVFPTSQAQRDIV